MRNRTQAFQKVQVGEWPEMSWKRGPGTGSQGWGWRAHFFRPWGTVVGLLGLKWCDYNYQSGIFAGICSWFKSTNTNQYVNPLWPAWWFTICILIPLRFSLCSALCPENLIPMLASGGSLTLVFQKGLASDRHQKETRGWKEERLGSLPQLPPDSVPGSVSDRVVPLPWLHLWLGFSNTWLSSCPLESRYGDGAPPLQVSEFLNIFYWFP